MIRKGLKPGFKFGPESPTEGEGFRKDLPFRRSGVAIAIVAAMDAAFLFPAVYTFRQALSEWRAYDSLFDLVGALFLSAWLIGWSMAPLILTAILVMMLFGREVMKAGPGLVEIFVGIPVFGVTMRYEVGKMRNLRFETPVKKSGTSWRGPHLVFDYGANPVAVGSGVSESEAAQLRHQLESATGAKIPHRSALAAETSENWDSEAETPVIQAVARAAAPQAETPLSLQSPTTLALIAANLVPIAGSAFLGWNLSDVMVLYWAESAIVGFFNVCKIIVIGRWAALFAAPFFIGHFGGFMAVHFLFIYTIFVEPSQSGGSSGGDLAQVAALFTGLWPALLALFASHAFSFFANFMGRREYVGRKVNDQMGEPYGRIIFMHLVLIFGGGLAMVLGTPAPVILIVIALKIFFDVKAHLKQHSGDGRVTKPAA